jgi:hypothetical protein
VASRASGGQRMSETTRNDLDIRRVQLSHGKHAPNGEFCVMEAVAYIAGEKWTDAPKCASPAIAGFLRVWNDGMSDDDRQLLRPLIPLLVNSRGSDEAEKKRYMIAFDWQIRVQVPEFLDAAGLSDHASKLRTLKEFTEPSQLLYVPALSAAELAAESALSAVRSAASAESAALATLAASAAASAERSAASAARSVGLSAALSAADSAESVSARTAGLSAAKSGAAGLAESAAALAARSVALATLAASASTAESLSAAESVVTARLRPLVERLQLSAFRLVLRMLEVK